MANYGNHVVCARDACSHIVAHGLTCYSCQGSYHWKCSDVSSENWQLYCTHTGLTWTCQKCKTLSKLCSRLLKEVSTSDGPTEDPDQTMPCYEPVETKRTKSPRKTNHIEKSQPKKAGNKGQVEVTKTNVMDAFENQADGGGSMSTRLAELEDHVKYLRAQVDGLTGRSKSLLVHNLAEPFMRDSKSRKQTEMEKARNIMRLAGMHPSTPITKLHRVGVWRPQGQRSPRPLLIVFETISSRDFLLMSCGSNKPGNRRDD